MEGNRCLSRSKMSLNVSESSKTYFSSILFVLASITNQSLLFFSSQDHWVEKFSEQFHDVSSADIIAVAPPVVLTAKLKRPYFEIPFAVSVKTYVLFLGWETFLSLWHDYVLCFMSTLTQQEWLHLFTVWTQTFPQMKSACVSLSLSLSPQRNSSAYSLVSSPWVAFLSLISSRLSLRLAGQQLDRGRHVREEAAPAAALAGPQHLPQPPQEQVSVRIRHHHRLARQLGGFPRAADGPQRMDRLCAKEQTKPFNRGCVQS